MFTIDSALVQIWAKHIKEGNKTIEQVPNLSNLIDMVKEVIK